ncbi:MAG: leader peptidase (prepilin peptidase) / N-methyltransferase [Actinomycetota bacterium]|nr:leader peptidase (prepilin peptidase) / N-methyltransferase [Actinomycetota bacterium]
MLVTLCTVLGLAVGSFLTVVVERVPAGEPVLRPVARCSSCKAAVAPRDAVPLLGRWRLRGRARCCGAPLPRRDLFVEVATAVAFGAVAFWNGPTRLLPALLYLAAVSIALAVIDIDTLRLPFAIVAPSYPVALVLLGGAAAIGADRAAAVRMLAGAAIWWGLYRLLHAIYPNGMGYGDVRLSGVLGLFTGYVGWPHVAVGLLAGFVVGGIAGLAFIAIGRRKLGSSIPYGPYLLTGAWIGLVAGEPVADWYLRSVGL